MRALCAPPVSAQHGAWPSQPALWVARFPESLVASVPMPARAVLFCTPGAERVVCVGGVRKRVGLASFKKVKVWGLGWGLVWGDRVKGKEKEEGRSGLASFRRVKVWGLGWGLVWGERVKGKEKGGRVWPASRR